LLNIFGEYSQAFFQCDFKIRLGLGFGNRGFIIDRSIYCSKRTHSPHEKFAARCGSKIMGN